MRTLILLLVFIGSMGLGCAASGDADPVPLYDEARLLMHDGQARQFGLYVPESYDETRPTPLVLDLHGATPDIVQANLAQPAISEITAIAEREGFIVLHPLGLKNADGTQTWNSGSCCADDMARDDMGFIAAVLDLVEAEFNIDPRRVFSMGMSNGGFMSHRLACEMSARIAAIGPVSGYNGMPTCAPSRPVSVMSFVGDAEGMYSSVVSSTDEWVARDGCELMPSVTYDVGEVTCQSWAGCDAGAEVVLCSVAGGGHTWPGGGDIIARFTGEHQTEDIIATEALWEFFERHPMP